MVLRNAFGQVATEDTQQDVLSTLTGYKNPYGALLIGNARSKFRDGFTRTDVTQPDPNAWDLTQSDPAHFAAQGGNMGTSSYLTLSLSPFDDGSGIRIVSKNTFRFPFRAGFGISVSQRIPGQEVFFGVVGVDSSGNIETDSGVADVPVTGTASVTSNVATLTVPNHGYRGGDRVILFGCQDLRFNVGPVSLSVIDRNTITVPVTIANGTYTVTGGTIRYCDFIRGGLNAAGILLENATTTNGSFSTKRNGSRQRVVSQTIASTTANQVNGNPYTDSFVSNMVTELYASLEEVSYRSYGSDSNGGIAGSNKWSQGIPDEEKDYKLIVRARNLDGLTKPIVRVLTASKTASSTATITTDTAHGLVVGDWVQIYGLRDQTNFANSGATQVASVISTTSFTVAFGASATASSTGGAVIKMQGGLSFPGGLGQSIQSISRTSNVITIIGNTTWTGPANGDNVNIWGLEPSAIAYEGVYKVLRISGTTMELQAPGADFGSINTGGTVIRRTDVRVHFVRVMDYTRNYTEIIGGRGTGVDANNAVPVTVSSVPTTLVQQSTAIPTATPSSMWATAGWGGFLVNDVASAALTSSTTTGSIVPGVVNNVGTNAHSFGVVVTAVSGTTPTLDVSVEESPDNGTNWVRIYDFPRITANGVYNSPIIPATWGTRYRYVQTVSGTSPSFTRSINRMQHSVPASMLRSFIDRSIVFTTLGSTTPVYFVERAKSFFVTAALAGATTPPVLVLEGTEDLNASYYTLGTLNPTANASTVLDVENVRPKYVRLRVSTAGAGVSAGYFVTIKAIE